MALPSTLTLLATFLLAIATCPTALGLTINGQPITTTQIGGVAYCPNTSLANGGTYTLLSQVPVELRCGNDSTDTLLQTVTTDLAGTYSFLFNIVDALLFDPNTCYLRIQLSSTVCLPSGNLRLPIVVLNVVQALLAGVVGNLLFVVNGIPSVTLN